MTHKMRGARLIAQMLKAYGITHVFFMDAVLRRALAEMEEFGTWPTVTRGCRAAPLSAWRSR